MLTPQFEWSVARGGYGWIETESVQLGSGKRGHGLFLADDWAAESQPNLAATLYDPFVDQNGLCRTLAATAPDQKGILAFANRFGSLLGPHGSMIKLPHRPASAGGVQAGRGEGLEVWQDAIGHLQLVCNVWDMIRERNRSALERHVRWRDGLVEFETHPELPEGTRPPAPFIRITRTLGVEERHPSFFSGMERGDVFMPAYRFIQHLVNEKLVDCAPRMLWDNASGSMSLRLVPGTLLGATWLQMGLAIERGIGFRQCAECDVWFEISPEGGRSDKLYCSNACRVRAHRQRLPQRASTAAKAKGRKVRHRERVFEAATTSGRTAKSKRPRR